MISTSHPEPTPQAPQDLAAGSTRRAFLFGAAGIAATASLGISGGVIGAIATATPAAAATAMMTTCNVNLRTGPGTSYSIITAMPAGASVTATGVVSGSWTQVIYNGRTGYAYSSYLKVAATTLNGQITSLMTDSRITSASVGIVVIDLTTSKEIYTRNATTKLTPASNNKILTTAAALEKMGTAYQFPTKIYLGARPANGVVNGNIYIKGYGDPTLTEANLKSIAAGLRSAGITKVTGQLVADATYFDATTYNAYWYSWIYSTCDVSQVAALTLQPNSDNPGTVLVNYKGVTAGTKAQISLTPASAAGYLTIVNQTTTGGSTDTIAMKRASSTSNTLYVTGNVPVGRSSYGIKPVNSPSLYAAYVFRKALAASGITVVGSTVSGATPSTAILQYTHKSATLGTIVRRAMKLSNNTQCEQIAKALGAYVSGQPGSWANGAAAVKAALAPSGVTAADLTLVDGSGEAYGNKVSARSITKILTWARTRPWFGTWLDSFPLAASTNGIDGGTLVNRFTGTPAAYNLRAKTGTLSDISTKVTALSGFVTGKNGHTYMFSSISNYTGSTPKPVVDQMGVILASWSGA